MKKTLNLHIVACIWIIEQAGVKMENWRGAIACRLQTRSYFPNNGCRYKLVFRFVPLHTLLWSDLLLFLLFYNKQEYIFIVIITLCVRVLGDYYHFIWIAYVHATASYRLSAHWPSTLVWFSCSLPYNICVCVCIFSLGTACCKVKSLTFTLFGKYATKITSWPQLN